MHVRWSALPAEDCLLDILDQRAAAASTCGKSRQLRVVPTLPPPSGRTNGPSLETSRNSGKAKLALRPLQNLMALQIDAVRPDTLSVRSVVQWPHAVLPTQQWQPLSTTCTKTGLNAACHALHAPPLGDKGAAPRAKQNKKAGSLPRESESRLKETHWIC